MAKLDTCYAIIDAASEPAIFAMLDELDPPASCLYSEPIQPEIVELAPYLVEVNDEVRKWLSQRETPWGIYVYTQATMRELRQHLRKYLMVMIPDQEKPVFWRYYDPRIVWDFLDTFDNWRLHTFLGPITKVATELWGGYMDANFEDQRRDYPETVKKSGKLMQFTESEMSQLSDIKKELLIAKMTLFFVRVTDRYQCPDQLAEPMDELAQQFIYNPKITSIRFFTQQKFCSEETWKYYSHYARDLHQLCNEYEIYQLKSIGLLCYLFAFYDVYDINNIPEKWHVILSTIDAPEFYKVEKLSLELIKTLPNFYR